MPRDNRFAATVGILLPFGAEIARQFDPAATRCELLQVIHSIDFANVSNSEAHYAAELQHFRNLEGPLDDAAILRMGAFLYSDASESMELNGTSEGPGSDSDRSGLAFEAFHQLVERACVHMILYPTGVPAPAGKRIWWCLGHIPQVGDCNAFSIYPDEATARSVAAQMEKPGCWEVFQLEEGLTAADVPVGAYR